MSAPTYLIYDAVTGRPSRSLRCLPEHLAPNVQPGEATIESTWVPDGTQFVEAGALRRCQDYSLAKLPLPCTVRIEGVEYKCTTQPVFEFDVPGEYQIKVDAGPRFLKKEFTYAYPPRGR